MLFPGPYQGNGPAQWWSRATAAETVDERLARLVRQRLYGDPWTCLRRVRVQVQNRVVILEGQLNSAWACWVAVDHAWQTPGVVDVCDVLTGSGHVGDDRLS